MKKATKILSLLLVLTLVLMPTLALAAPGGEFGSDLLNTSKAANTVSGMSSVGKAFSSVISIVKFVGYAIAIIMVLVLAIQWIIATPAKKAELKGKMWSIGIGLILLVGGVTIIDAVMSFGNNLGQ